jgi:hypothetical protein
MTFATHHLAFSATATTPMALDAQPGSSLRGAFVGALLQRFCANKAAQHCAACPLLNICPIAQLIAPMRGEGETGGDQRPRPYVTRPPKGRSYAPGETLTFGLGLFGGPAQLFPYVVLAAQELSEHGLGRPLPVNGGRRGCVRIDAIDAVNPLTAERQPLFRLGSAQVRSPGLPVGQDEVAVYAASLPGDQITLRFPTPLRLIDQKKLVKPFAPRPFFQRLIERLNELSRAYGDGALIDDYLPLVAHADTIRVVHDATRWVDVLSNSRRQGGHTPIGGLVGELTLVGDLVPLRELLAWGSLIHVGKNAVKGDGWYQLVPDL